MKYKYDEYKSQIVHDYYELNYSFKQISEKYKIPHTSVECCFKRWNLKPRYNKNTIIDMVGKKIGKLTVLSYAHGQKGAYWNCRCECGTIKPIYGSNLRQYKTSCGNCVPNANFKGIQNLSLSYFNRLKYGAKQRGIEFKITMEDMLQLWKHQNGICQLSGEAIQLTTNMTSICHTASLDRIDSKKGYVKDNIQWLHKDVNVLKNNFSEKELLVWCQKITNHQIKNSS